MADFTCANPGVSRVGYELAKRHSRPSPQPTAASPCGVGSVDQRANCRRIGDVQEVPVACHPTPRDRSCRWRWVEAHRAALQPREREVGRCRRPMPMHRRRRQRQAAGDSGARHPHASPRLGRAFSARGHTEREESGVKGRQDPRSRARRRTRRASGAERRRTDGAQRTMIPKISSPVVSTATAVQLRCFEPLRSTRSQDPQATQHSLRVQHHGCEHPDQRVCCENAEAATHRSGSPLP